jgi:chemotaxis signal transduction protein
MSTLTSVPRLQTVLVLLDVAGRQVGLPIAVVQDVVKVQRTGPGMAWRIHRASVAAICPPGMLAVGDRCVPLVELCERLGLPPVAPARRVRSVVIVQLGEHVLGLLVDAVADIVEARCTALRPVVPTDGLHPAVRQLLRLDEREIEVLDADLLLDAPLARGNALWPQ